MADLEIIRALRAALKRTELSQALEITNVAEKTLSKFLKGNDGPKIVKNIQRKFGSVEQFLIKYGFDSTVSESNFYNAIRKPVKKCGEHPGGDRYIDLFAAVAYIWRDCDKEHIVDQAICKKYNVDPDNPLNVCYAPNFINQAKNHNQASAIYTGITTNYLLSKHTQIWKFLQLIRYCCDILLLRIRNEHGSDVSQKVQEEFQNKYFVTIDNIKLDFNLNTPQYDALIVAQMIYPMKNSPKFSYDKCSISVLQRLLNFENYPIRILSTHESISADPFVIFQVLLTGDISREHKSLYPHFQPIMDLPRTHIACCRPSSYIDYFPHTVSKEEHNTTLYSGIEYLLEWKSQSYKEILVFGTDKQQSTRLCAFFLPNGYLLQVGYFKDPHKLEVIFQETVCKWPLLHQLLVFFAFTTGMLFVAVPEVVTVQSDWVSRFCTVMNRTEDCDELNSIEDFCRELKMDVDGLALYQNIKEFRRQFDEPRSCDIYLDVLEEVDVCAVFKMPVDAFYATIAAIGDWTHNFEDLDPFETEEEPMLKPIRYYEIDFLEGSFFHR